MITVWKFELAITEAQVIDMPEGAELLAVHSQFEAFEAVQLWARVDTAQPPARRLLALCGTGQPAPSLIDDRAGVPQQARYVGSALMRDGAPVWHIFDGGEIW